MTLSVPLSWRARLALQRATLHALAAGGDHVAAWATGSPRRDPYVLYERLRARGPLVRSRLGVHAVTSHALADQVLRDPRFGVRRPDGGPVEPDPLSVEMPSPLTGSFLELDPPDHTRLRRLVAPAFRPARVRSWTPRVEEVAHTLLDDLERRLRAGGSADLMAGFASPFPVAVISDLLGIPRRDAAGFARIGTVVGQALDGIRSARHARELHAAGGELERMFRRLLDERATDPRDDVLSVLAAARAAGEATVEDALKTAGLLLVAGFETTVNLIGNGTAALHAHPAHWKRLTADPALAPRVVEEALRWDPSVQGTLRIAHAPVELAGRTLPTGTAVLVLTAAANRDPERHRDPAVFDPERPGVEDHLTFSSGIHYCLGAPLARLEGETAFRALAGRLPGLRVLPGPRRPGATIRGFSRLPVRLG